MSTHKKLLFLEKLPADATRAETRRILVDALTKAGFTIKPPMTHSQRIAQAMEKAMLEDDRRHQQTRQELAEAGLKGDLQ